MTSLPIHALTSLSPGEQSINAQRAALRTWREAGLHVRSFNHPSEIAAVASCYDVELVPVERTSADVFGRHFIPISRMLEWAAERAEAVIIINADIELRLAAWELKRARWVSDRGLCYFIRHNHDGELARAAREPFGIDAFLLSGADADLFADSFLSMGQPFWDYWLPHVFATARRPLVRVDYPAAFHRNHARRWSWENWHRCALEFGRVTHEIPAQTTMQDCQAMSMRVRDGFDRVAARLSPRPVAIREWVERTFADPGPKTFLELGAHCGTDTVWLSQIPGVTIHAFEPDPRNEQPPQPNVTIHRAAIADVDGRAPFLLSESGWGSQWTYSSSLKRPKNHLLRYPVTFGESIEVETVTLDTFAHRMGLSTVDFIWADIQGAEGEMVRGGIETLRRTHYLYTEYSDDELYEGQSTLADLLARLPDFRVVELWPDDVLLENCAFSPAAAEVAR
jgi:FkbM family methyltransferase